MRTLPYLFLVIAGGLSLATFLTSATLAETPKPVACAHDI